jgi:nucleoside phosphorylase
MGRRPYRIDFLIVTAYPDESKPYEELLEDPYESQGDLIGSISKISSSIQKYSVAVITVFKSGSVAAQAATTAAMRRHSPRFIILTGIAAGFHESQVRFGDVLVPAAIIAYEPGKVVKPSFWSKFPKIWKDSPKSHQHRSLPIRVSSPLWRAAVSIASKLPDWGSRIREPRPDGKAQPPTVHCGDRSVLGCGEKVIAKEDAEPRRWLVEDCRNFGYDVLGLEMESIGVEATCQEAGIPFIVIKAVQDDATERKDLLAEKDKWRKYAIEAASVFAINLINRFELESNHLALDHIREIKEIAERLDVQAPMPPFNYTVSICYSSYDALKRGQFDKSCQDPTEILIPHDARPDIILHGGGGTGKTRIIHSLIGTLLEKDLCPILIDLKRYFWELKKNGKEEKGENISTIKNLLHIAAPRRTPEELKWLAKESKIVVILDGLNELSRINRIEILEYFRDLRKEGKCYILATDRMGPDETVLGRFFLHGTVDKLDLGHVKNLYERVFGDGSFSKLDERLKVIYQKPFFLSISLRTGRAFSQGIMSENFRDFFLEHVGLVDSDLDKLAEATFYIERKLDFDWEKFKEYVGIEPYQRLVGSQIIDDRVKDFEHPLWRDYLIARYLSQRKDKWGYSAFDVATSFSASIETLSLILEQLPARAEKDNFIKKVFDWNYVAASSCISDLYLGSGGDLSSAIRVSILSSISEKRFDKVKRTRERAEGVLRGHNYPLAEPFKKATTLAEVIDFVKKADEADDWFRVWKSIFIKAASDEFSKEEAGHILAEDSLIGWAAANSARRSIWGEVRQRELRKVYEEISKDDDKRSIRWRIVHVLGGYPKVENVEFLKGVLEEDTSPWVQYGASRGLMEIASMNVTLRTKTLGILNNFVERYAGNIWVRRQIFEEIIETSFIRDSTPDWKKEVLPLLNFIANKEMDLADKVNGFVAYNQNG